MSVEVIEPNRLVIVTPDEIDERDVLELAEALIEEHGHKKHDSGSEADGWSIHGAVGEAARRVTDSTAKDSGPARVLRDKAKDRLERAHRGRTEYELNDTDAADAQDAVRLMREAREATI